MKAKKVLTLILCLVLVAALSVVGTLAYLTSSDTVTNTFSVGRIEITLDEYKTDEYGTADTTVERVKENAYLLVPGHTYSKDPTVHVKSDSEAAYLFVKVTNGIEEIEADTTIAAQIEANGWEPLAGEDGVYWMEYDKYVPEEGKETPEYIDRRVFESFTIDGTADSTTLSSYEEATVEIVAYAIQRMEIENEAAAWAALGN